MIGIGYGIFSITSGNNAYFSLAYYTMKNDITDVITYNDQLQQLASFTNVNGDNSFSLYMNLSKIKKDAGHQWNINLASYSTISQTHAFINSDEYISRNYNLSLHPSVTYSYKDLFDITPSYRTNFQYGSYSVASLNSHQNLMQEGELSFSLNWPWRISWESDWDYTRNSGNIADYGQAYWLWNASVDVALFKNKEGHLQFSVFDLLDQNIDLQRDISDTYIEDSQTKVLNRYFMLKFIYNLQKIGKQKKQENTPAFFF